MFKMVMSISEKEGAKVNGNTFEIVMEPLIEEGKWRESLTLIGAMERLDIRPTMAVRNLFFCLIVAIKQPFARQYA